MVDSLRQRHHVSSELYFSEENTQTRRSSQVSQTPSSSTLPIGYTVDPYDPDQLVPSYEASQRLHWGGSQGQEENANSLSGISQVDSASIGQIESSAQPIGGSGSKISRKEPRDSLKLLGLKFLNARQHFALALCRDVSLIPAIIGLYQSWRRALVEDFDPMKASSGSFTSARTFEHFLAGIWCIVSAFMSYTVLDGLMVRWIVTYLTSAAIVRMLSMSTILVTLEQYLVSTFSAEGYKYGLHVWILISCVLTLTYIVQSFVTLNLDFKGKERARFFDLYNIIVFAVVPIGIASFLTMIGLLRSLLILRLDIEENGLI